MVHCQHRPRMIVSAMLVTMGVLIVTSASGDGDPIGVKACDDYLKAWDACYQDAAVRAAAKPGLDQTRAAWKKAAATPQGKAGLATSCKMMLDNFPTAACTIGVKACDDYLKAWDACYKDPATRAAAKPGLDQTRAAWVQAAKDPKSRAGLATSCKMMLDNFPTKACK
jgi:hypothetical protein